MPKIANEFARYTFRVTLFSFLIGVFICVFVSSGEGGALTRELTRFLHLGIFLGAVMGAYIAYLLWGRIVRSFSLIGLLATLMFSFVMVLSILPTIEEASRWINGNLHTKLTLNYFGCTDPKGQPSRVLDISKRVDFLLKEIKIQSGGKC
jgi:peptidoglycan/LPS O-acetylase OafA/YrhL